MQSDLSPSGAEVARVSARNWDVWDQQQSAIHYGPGAALRDTGSPSRKEALGEGRYVTLFP